MHCHLSRVDDCVSIVQAYNIASSYSWASTTIYVILFLPLTLPHAGI